jgi:hypothetical protein
MGLSVGFATPWGWQNERCYLGSFLPQSHPPTGQAVERKVHQPANVSPREMKVSEK